MDFANERQTIASHSTGGRATKRGVDALIDEKGAEAAFGLGISDMHPRLTRLVGRMRFRNGTGQNLLQHCLETAIIAGHMAAEIGARADVAQRAGLLHEVGQVHEGGSAQPILTAADLCAKLDESQEVVKALRAACTPDFFLFDRDLRLVYRGQFDASRPSLSTPVTGRDLRAACDAVLSGDHPDDDQRPSIGCNIKWKPGNAPEWF